MSNLETLNLLYAQYSKNWGGHRQELPFNPLAIANAYYSKIPALKEILDHIEHKTNPECTTHYTHQHPYKDQKDVGKYLFEICDKKTGHSLHYTIEGKGSTAFGDILPNTFDTINRNLDLLYKKEYQDLSRLKRNNERLINVATREPILYRIEKQNTINARSAFYPGFKDREPSVQILWEVYYKKELGETATEHEKTAIIHKLNEGKGLRTLTNRDHIWNFHDGYDMICDVVLWIIQNILHNDIERFRDAQRIGPLFDILLDPEKMLSLLEDLQKK